MKLLLDQGLPRSAASVLTARGVDSIHVADIGYSNADDSEILLKATEDERVVVTLDSDFHALVALTGEAFPSVIRIRIQGLGSAAVTDLLLALVESYSEQLERGALVTVQDDKVRLRRLPITPKRNDG